MAGRASPAAGRLARAIAVALALLMLAPAIAGAAVTLEGTARELGTIRLVAEASPPVSDLQVVELVDGAEVTVPSQTTERGIEAVASWVCRPRERIFQAIGGGQISEPFTAKTPSCAHRVHIRTRRAVSAGHNVRVTIRDRWLIGDVRARLCVRPAGDFFHCRRVVIPSGQIETSRIYPAPIVGDWAIRLAVHGRTVARSVSVVGTPREPRPRQPKLLATGDSTIINPMRVLRTRLSGRASVVPDIYVSSAITRPFVVDWATLPRKQMRAEGPDAVAISLGIGDGGPLRTPAGTVSCCGSDWIAAYASRARRLMRSYARRGAAVVWLNVPYVRDAARSETIAAVNAGLALAADGLERVRVVDVAAILTPRDVFEQWLRRGNRIVKVRRDDGIHMTRAGATIVDRAVTRELTLLGVL